MQQVSLKRSMFGPRVAYRVSDILTPGRRSRRAIFTIPGCQRAGFRHLVFCKRGLSRRPRRRRWAPCHQPQFIWGVGYDFGVLVEPSADLRLGMNYKSGIHAGLGGNAHFNVPAVATPLTAGSAFTDTSGVARPELSAGCLLGAVWTRSGRARWTALVDAKLTQWSDVQAISRTLPVTTPAVAQPLHWHDSWRVAIGAIYRLTDDTDLRAGFGFDQSPIGDQFRTALLPEADDITIGAGVSHRITDHLKVSLSSCRLASPQRAQAAPAPCIAAPASSVRASPCWADPVAVLFRHFRRACAALPSRKSPILGVPRTTPQSGGVTGATRPRIRWSTRKISMRGLCGLHFARHPQPRRLRPVLGGAGVPYPQKLFTGSRDWQLLGRSAEKSSSMEAYAIFAGGGVKGVVFAGCLVEAKQHRIEFLGYGGASAGSLVALLASIVDIRPSRYARSVSRT